MTDLGSVNTKRWQIVAIIAVVLIGALVTYYVTRAPAPPPLTVETTDDSDEVIDARMERARAEISHWDAYDYVVINEDVGGCFAKVREILDAERMKRQRQTGLIPFVRELMS